MRAAFAAGLVALSPGAWACGYCAEEKVAATYDHAVVTKALGSGRVVVFAEVSGGGSVRVSQAPVTVSFAMKTTALSPEGALAAAERASTGGLRLTLPTVMR